MFTFFLHGCKQISSDVNKCIDSQLSKYDTLYKDLENRKRFKKAFCIQGFCKTRADVKSDCFIAPYSQQSK